MEPTVCIVGGCGHVGLPLGIALADAGVQVTLLDIDEDRVRRVTAGRMPFLERGADELLPSLLASGRLQATTSVDVIREHETVEDFNLSTQTSTTVLELAELIWKKIHGEWKPFQYVSDDPFPYDERCRIPSVEKARNLLGFEATATLDEILDEVIPWVDQQLEAGVI